MDAILGHKQATQPPVVVESGEAAILDCPAQKSGEEEEEESVSEDLAK